MQESSSLLGESPWDALFCFLEGWGKRVRSVFWVSAKVEQGHCRGCVKMRTRPGDNRTIRVSPEGIPGPGMFENLGKVFHWVELTSRQFSLNVPENLLETGSKKTSFYLRGLLCKQGFSSCCRNFTTLKIILQGTFNNKQQCVFIHFLLPNPLSSES